MIHLGRFWVTFFARPSKFEPRKDTENEQKVPKKEVKKGSKMGRFWVSDPLSGVIWDPHFGVDFFRSISRFADGTSHFLSKTRFPKWTEKCLFEKLIYKMSSTLTRVCACARAYIRARVRWAPPRPTPFAPGRARPESGSPGPGGDSAGSGPKTDGRRKKIEKTRILNKAF